MDRAPYLAIAIETFRCRIKCQNTRHRFSDRDILSHISLVSLLVRFTRGNFFSTRRISCSPPTLITITSSTQSTHSLTCFSVGKRKCDRPLFLATCRKECLEPVLVRTFFSLPSLRINHLGPVVRSMLIANHRLTIITTYMFLCYLTLVSNNHA